jgi:hypothetical protein
VTDLDFERELARREALGELSSEQANALAQRRQGDLRKARERAENDEASRMRKAWRAMDKIAAEHGFVLATVAEPGSCGLAIRWDTMRLRAKTESNR